MEEKQTNYVLMVKDLRVSYAQEEGGLFHPKKDLDVLKGVSFSIREGEVLGLVGESGCGKSTLSKALLGLIPKYEGVIVQKSLHPQMIFQDPYSSLNPVKKVGWILEEPLRLNTELNKQQRREKVLEMLKKVGLEEKQADRYPRQLSGGQRQRVCIAESLMLSPRLLIADEPVSALDVTIQAQVISLLRSIQKEMGLAILFISHDMRVVYQLSQRVMIMKDGEIVESGDVDDVYFHPEHPYTKRLLEAAGIESPRRRACPARFLIRLQWYLFKRGMKYMFEKFYPDSYVESAYVIDYEGLYKKGYRGIIFDIDNTLVPHGAPADERSIALFRRLKAIGYECLLLSNNKEPRVKMFNDAVHVHYIFKAGKPGVKNYEKAMDIMGTDDVNTFFVGDQLFTDVWGARNAGLYSFLVKPINPKEEIQIVLKRYLEKIVLHSYKKKLAAGGGK